MPRRQAGTEIKLAGIASRKTNRGPRGQTNRDGPGETDIALAGRRDAAGRQTVLNHESDLTAGLFDRSDVLSKGVAKIGKEHRGILGGV